MPAGKHNSGVRVYLSMCFYSALYGINNLATNINIHLGVNVGAGCDNKDFKNLVYWNFQMTSRCLCIPYRKLGTFEFTILLYSK